jgi:predicted Fe-Mo cluster-binding NifX family protein
MGDLTMLRIAIPTKNDRLFPHFGRAPSFAIFEADPSSRRILESHVLESSPQEECRGAIDKLVGQKVDVVIAGGIGQGAHNHLTAAGIEVFAGADAQTTGLLVERFLAGELARGEPTCHGHNHERGHGQNHGHGGGHGHGCRRDGDHRPHSG